ncbi:MAG: hypothetical protein ACK455_02850, partial [Bacteroidota bacterium]
FFNWALPKPIHFFFLIKKSKQKKSRLHFIFSSYGRNYFFLQNCDLSGDLRAKALSFPKGSRILLHKNNQIKLGRFSLRKNAMFLIIWKEKR